MSSVARGLVCELLHLGGHHRKALRSVDLSSATTGSLTKKDVGPSAGHKRDAAAKSLSGGAQSQRYVVHRATGGSALIAGSEGLWWITLGMTLPGIGQIISIERCDAGWVPDDGDHNHPAPAAQALS
jgi:hypothetical protein